MKIKKGNVTRNIDEKQLAVYKAKGYQVVEFAPEPAREQPDPPRRPREPKE